MHNITRQYLGYLGTPTLWKQDKCWGIPAFTMPTSKVNLCKVQIENGLRLGKRVERFVSFELETHQNIKIVSENLQIQKEKQTIGEIDCILKQDEAIIHLEIVYKFYLYDPTVGDTEFEHWIGPNRRDSLIHKLSKLKDKQFPLLYRPETQNYLEKLDINVETVDQEVFFKAQLFIPYGLQADIFKDLNPKCVKGFYISANVLDQFNDCKFYIPNKVDWLCDIETQIPWLSFSNFKEKIKILMEQQRAPLCWIKHYNGITEKCFIVWW